MRKVKRSTLTAKADARLLGPDDGPGEYDIAFAGYSSVQEALSELYVTKQSDYGNSFDKTLDRFGIVAALTRMADKWERILSLHEKGEPSVIGESMRDSFIDLANYAIMTVAWMDRGRNEDHD